MAADRSDVIISDCRLQFPFSLTDNRHENRLHNHNSSLQQEAVTIVTVSVNCLIKYSALLAELFEQ